MAVRVARHWHVTERYGRSRLLAPKMQVVMYLGADTKEAAYTAFSKRANVLMLEGWELDPYGSSDTVCAVRRDKESRVLDVTECWDEACLAARPAAGLPEPSSNGHLVPERLPDDQQPATQSEPTSGSGQ